MSKKAPPTRGSSSKKNQQDTDQQAEQEVAEYAVPPPMPLRGRRSMLLSADSLRWGAETKRANRSLLEEEEGEDVSSTRRNSTSNTQMSRAAAGSDLKRSARPQTRLSSTGMTSPPLPSGSRRTSVALRLKEQGLRPTSKPSKNYAVQSIQRGSDEWRTLLRPFVADLALRSIVKRHSRQRGVTFRPYHCQAAVLFVDLSGYSRITSAIAHRGAHAISDTVNAYMERLLSIVDEYGGDVVKFAGDAIVVVWAGSLQQLELNVFCAARCALELQVQASSHRVEGTGLMFRIHCGLCCGPIDSEIFEAPKHESMQRLFHSLGGEAMIEIGELVDLSKAGETAVSSDCILFLEGSGQYQNIPGESNAKLLSGLVLEQSLVDIMEIHVVGLKKEREIFRAKLGGQIEEDFIHEGVLEALQHGGLSPTQISQIRDLCVLFVAMTAGGDPVNWLLEVQEILDRHRCPMVQIIDDDKGVHVVAAINLHDSIPEAPLAGLKVCRELADKRIGAAVGMAVGPTFCGVTGSSTACRWDITGSSVVRAARLMQYALQEDIRFAIDQSVYDDPMASSHMKVVDPFVSLKGTNDAVTVYTISDSKHYPSSRVVSNARVEVHMDKVHAIHNFNSSRSRSAVIVTGAPLAGKKLVCQCAAGMSNITPYLHLSDESSGFLSLALSVGTWFRYVDDEEVRKLAQGVLKEMDQKCWSGAHDMCVELVSSALSKGYRACFIVDRVQALDRFSLSLIREILRPWKRRVGGSRLRNSVVMNAQQSECPGAISFLCVHVPFYNSKSADDIAQDITRVDELLNVPVIDINEAGLEELRTVFRELSGMDAEERLLHTFAESSGYAAGYFIERVIGVHNLSMELCSLGKSPLLETNENFQLQIPPRMLCTVNELTVTQLRPEVAMRFSQAYDDFDPIGQTCLKILSIATRKFRCPLRVQIVWECLNDLMALGVEREEFYVLLNEMVQVRALRLWNDTSSSSIQDDRAILIQSPALADIAMEVCTPVQVKSIAVALIERLECIQTDDEIHNSLILANLYDMTDSDSPAFENYLHAAALGVQRGKEEGSISISVYERLKEAVKAEWEVHGLEISRLPFVHEERVPVGPVLPGGLDSLKAYVAPPALGPLGCTLAALCCNIFHEYCSFGGLAAACSKSSQKSALTCGRYMVEISTVEEFLQDNGYGCSPEVLSAEFEFVSFLANAPASKEDVETKAMLILEELVPRFVLPRLNRVVQFASSLTSPPTLVSGADRAVQQAFAVLHNKRARTDAAQESLMILAVLHWRPAVHPDLPVLHPSFPSISNLRDEIMSPKLTAQDSSTSGDPLSVFEAFLILTTILANVHD